MSFVVSTSSEQMNVVSHKEEGNVAVHEAIAQLDEVRVLG